MTINNNTQGRTQTSGHDHRQDPIQVLDQAVSAAGAQSFQLVRSESPENASSRNEVFKRIQTFGRQTANLAKEIERKFPHQFTLVSDAQALATAAERPNTEPNWEHIRGLFKAVQAKLDFIASRDESLQSIMTRISGVIKTQVIWQSVVVGKTFHSAIAAAKQSTQFGAFVDLKPVNEYNSMKLALLDHGLEINDAGVAVTHKGDIVSVFKHSKFKVKGVAHNLLVPKAYSMGGTHLDCFNRGLPGIYSKQPAGMVPVAKVRFDSNQKPSDWNDERDQEPDIIFMVRGDGSEKDSEEIEQIIKSLEYSDNYESAKKIQEEKAAQFKN